MYKIQNLAPGALSLGLEKGSISLPSGGSYDLELLCSRKWIKNDPTLKRFLAASYIRVLHDSEVVIPSTPIRSVIPKPHALQTPSARPPKAKPPVIIDFSLPEIVEVEKPKCAAKVEAPVVLDLSVKADPTPLECAPVVVKSEPVFTPPLNVVEPVVEEKEEVVEEKEEVKEEVEEEVEKEEVEEEIEEEVVEEEIEEKVEKEEKDPFDLDAEDVKCEEPKCEKVEEKPAQEGNENLNPDGSVRRKRGRPRKNF